MTEPRTAPEFATSTCTAPAARSDRMRDLVVAEASRDRPIRILDLGCGTGSLAFRLADALPRASIVGIDLSPANVDAAQAQLNTCRDRDRVQFVTADYLAYRAGAFDMIVADGVVHLLPGDTETLVRKLASDLRAGGSLVCAMPFRCIYNSALSGIRTLLRRMRAPWLDRTILQIGRLLHRRHMDDAGLRERIAYMYIPPFRVMDGKLLESFVAVGLYPKDVFPMPSSSLSQLRYRVTVFVRAT